MNIQFKIMAVTVIAIGGILMANQYGNCNSQNYKEYSSEDIQLNIIMDYISDWRYHEHRGSNDSYAQVQFIGALKDGVAPSVVVTVEQVSKVDFNPVTIHAKVDDLIEKRMKFEDAKVISKTETQLLGLTAIDLILAYQQPDQMHSLDATMVPFKEHIIVFQKDGRFYTLRYINPEKDYAAFERDFMHSIKSLRIKG